MSASARPTASSTRRRRPGWPTLPDEPANTAPVESGGYFLEVNPGLSEHLFDRLEIGMDVAVTGVAFIEKEHWRPVDGPDRLKKILALTVKMMKVSREELRDCIWDLRNRMLDEKHFDDAIRRILTPHLDGAQLRLRFPVRRADVSDRTAHATFSFLRELTANAVRHGKADDVSVAGALEGGRLMFSVADNGTGFDPQSAPGPGEGHFGLAGIRERIRNLGGTLRIDAAPGRGTKATISIPT